MSDEAAPVTGPLVPEIVGPVPTPDPEPIHRPHKRALVLTAQAKEALEYLVNRLLPYYPAGEALLRQVCTPLLEQTCSRKADWRAKIAASRTLAEMIGLYTAGEQSARLQGFRALPRRRNA